MLFLFSTLHQININASLRQLYSCIGIKGHRSVESELLCSFHFVFLVFYVSGKCYSNRCSDPLRDLLLEKYLKSWSILNFLTPRQTWDKSDSHFLCQLVWHHPIQQRYKLKISDTFFIIYRREGAMLTPPPPPDYPFYLWTYWRSYPIYTLLFLHDVIVLVKYET